jgi:type I restriction enzyme S subunit
VTADGLVFDDCSFISSEKDAELSTGKLIRNDVVFTTRGTIGNVGIFDKCVSFDHIRINSAMVILRPDTFTLCTRFLCQLLCSPIFSTQVDRILSGSVNRNFRFDP